LRAYESVIVSRFLFSRKIRGAATFDFCNTINPSGDDGCEIRPPQSDVPRPASAPDTIALVLLCQ